MAVRQPTVEEIFRIADAYNLNPSPADVESYIELSQPILDSYARLDQLTAPSLPVKYPRAPGARPQPEDNPLGAWYWRCDITGPQGGLLSGKTVAIKDNVCVAGVPMMNGTGVLEGYVPDVDATIVTRILDAGGSIQGKAVCESLCFSGGSHTSDTGPVHNPHDPTRTAGGSSSGSAALVAAGEVDLAIGGDQGGSIRIPASWCGIYGLKPTYGLVPYTGVFPIELTLDHTGPMARTAADVALMLEAIAGPDGLDPRQKAGLSGQAYTQALTGDVSGLRLGIVQEGFGLAESEADVDEAVRQAAGSFESMGATGGYGIHTLAPRRNPRVAGHRRGRGHDVDGSRQQHGHQLEGPLHHRLAGRVRPRLADPRRRPVGNHQTGRPDGTVHAGPLSRTLLRQGPEPGPNADRGLRPGARRVRPAGDAHAAHESHGHSAGRLQSPGVH